MPEVPVPSSSTSYQPADAAAVEPTLPSAATKAGPAIAGPRYGRFAVQRFHAQGGLGEVLVATDEELGRDVAFKRIRPDKAGSAEVRRRFVREAEITGKLEHPGIVPIYGLVQDEHGQPCYAMRFIAGESLAEAIKQWHSVDASFSSLAFRQLLQRFISVCQTMAYAHSKGVIHRDLKPANIMLGPYGETLVVDWGLAKETGARHQESGAGIDQEGSLDCGPTSTADTELSETRPVPSDGTQMGQALGTPAYMAPEQAHGEWFRVGPAADLFSLGAVLYELLTGRKPLHGQDVFEVLEKAKTADFPPPRRVVAAVPRPLEAICLKAMAWKPEDRYAGATDLAADVEQWLADEPVSAYGEPWPVRARRWMRRHRALVGSALAGLVVALILLTAGVFLLDAARQREEDAKNRATAQEQETQVYAEFLEHDVLATAREEGVQSGQGVKVTMAEAVRNALPRVAEKFAGRPVAEARVRHALGITLRHQGEAAAAAEQLRQALALRQRELGPEAEDTLASANSLGVALTAAGRPADAIAVLEPLREQWLRTLGPGHPATLHSMNNLALAYHAAGQRDQALSLLEQTLAKRKEVFGLDHPGTLESMHNLAAMYVELGQLAKASALAERTLARRTALLGPDHPDTLRSRNQVAVTYHLAGQRDRATAIFEQTLAAFREKLGPDHPQTLHSLSNLAKAYREAGRLDKALPLFEELRASLTKRLGPDHPDTLAAMHELALAYYQAGQRAKALTLDEETLVQRKAKLGPDHVDTLTTMTHLADMYREAGQPNKAVPLLEDALAQFQEHYAPDYPETAHTMHNLAKAYYLVGQRDKAIPLLERTVPKFRALFGLDHPDTLTTMYNLAMIYEAAGQRDRALPLWEEVLKLRRVKLGPDHPGTLATQANLAAAYDQTGRFAQAEPLHRAALDQARRQFGTDDARTAGPMAQLGLNLLQQKKGTEAEPLLRDCLAIREKNQPDEWTTFNTRSLLGGALLVQKKYADAEPLLLAAYAGMMQREKTIPPQGSTRIPEAIERLAQLYEATGKKDEATKWRTELDAVKTAQMKTEKQP